MRKMVLVLFAAVFILGACSGEKPVAASHDKMRYDYSEPDVLDDNKLITPHTTVIVKGEVMNISEAVSNMFASRISSREDQEYESVTFKETNVFGIESEDGEDYLVLTDDIGAWVEGDLITVTGTFEGINDRTFLPLIKADSMEEFTSK